MPIGNLISQHLANLYLGSFDHWIKEELRIKGYLRYMDDMLVFARESMELKALLNQAEYYLKHKLRLQINPNIHLNRCRQGFTFLGYRVFPSRISLSSRSKRRFSKKLKFMKIIGTLASGPPKS
jgi:hypothetical protein